MYRLFLLLPLVIATTVHAAPEKAKKKDACDLAAEDRKSLRLYEGDAALGVMVDVVKPQLAQHAKECGLKITEPKIGMWYQDVVRSTSWAAPDDMVKTETADGVDYQLIYGKGRYLYLHNGQVTAIQDRTGK